tara:strand:- start:8325 stop:8573 length:249 start_codon:yes stop_codon:yes gene_type:complete
MWNLFGMALECNIDAEGKAARLRVGILAVAGGIGMAVLVGTGLAPSIGWWAVAGSIVGGSFAMWEARAGWCVVRALGIKTPM